MKKELLILFGLAPGLALAMEEQALNEVKQFDEVVTFTIEHREKLLPKRFVSLIGMFKQRENASIFALPDKTSETFKIY